MNQLTAAQFTELSTRIGLFAGISHRGVCRTANEDRFLIKALADDAVLIAVADGLSGGAGNRDSEMVIDTLSQLPRIPNGLEGETLYRIVWDLDHAIHAKNIRNDSPDGMGSTLVCALLKENQLHWIHVGDSRFYLWRDQSLNQITQDQTLARFLLAEGEITLQQMATHYSRHVMDQYLGCGYCEPESGRLAIHPADRFLFCSDGLYRRITPSFLSASLDMQQDPAAAAKKLLTSALDAGGQDNITLVIGTGGENHVKT